MQQCSGNARSDQRTLGVCSLAFVSLLLILLWGCSSEISGSSDRVLETILGGHDTVAVDLRRLSTGHSAVDIELNGVKGVFVLDTGAETSVVHAPLLERYGVDPSAVLGTEAGAGAGGVITVRYYRGVSVSLGGYQLTLPKVASTDLSAVVDGLAVATGVQVDGVIGQDLLFQARGIVDVADNRLYLRMNSHGCKEGSGCNESIDAAMDNRGYDRITLTRLPIGLLVVPAAINGEPGDFILDSGARTSFVHSRHLARFGISEQDETGAGAITSGAGGTVRVKTYRIGEMTILDHAVDRPTLGATDLSAVIESIALRGRARIDGVIGLDVLSGRDAVIDARLAVLYLRRAG